MGWQEDALEALNEEVERRVEEKMNNYPIRIFYQNYNEMDITKENQDGGELWLWVEVPDDKS